MTDSGRRVPRAVQGALMDIGQNLRTWRELTGASVQLVAARSGVSAATIRRLEQGHGASLENVLRVARTIPVMDDLVRATDPFANDRGRALAQTRLGQGSERR